MFQPYIRVLLLSDYYYEKIVRICRAAEIDFQRLAGPRNVSVDLN